MTIRLLLKKNTVVFNEKGEHTLFLGTTIGGNGSSYTIYAEATVNVSEKKLVGDVNQDGKLNSKDVSAYLKYLADSSCEINLNSADWNNDGKTNSKDVSAMLKAFAEA